MPKSTEALKAAHDRLTQAVESIVTGEDWQRMLQVASKFHRYSFHNQLVEPHSIGPVGCDLVRRASPERARITCFARSFRAAT